ncbi:MAG: hypothetical protein QM619_06890 [Micropruina sp.]
MFPAGVGSDTLSLIDLDAVGRPERLATGVSPYLVDVDAAGR